MQRRGLAVIIFFIGGFAILELEKAIVGTVTGRGLWSMFLLGLWCAWALNRPGRKREPARLLDALLDNTERKEDRK